MFWLREPEHMIKHRFFAQSGAGNSIQCDDLRHCAVGNTVKHNVFAQCSTETIVKHCETIPLPNTVKTIVVEFLTVLYVHLYTVWHFCRCTFV